MWNRKGARCVGRLTGFTLPIDRAKPVLLVRIGSYPLNHGALGAIRSLGRLGVPVYATLEGPRAPVALSRYLAGRFVWPTTGGEDPDRLVGALLGFAAAVGGRPIAVATDDEAAILLAEHSDRLAAGLTLPRLERGLPRTLASKHDLGVLCRRLGIPAPKSGRPRSPAEALELARSIGFPLVIKNDAAYSRLSHPGVSGTTVIRDLDGLRRVLAGWPLMPEVVLQEHVPGAGGSDWMADAYYGSDADQAVVLTARKVRSWPPHAGVTSYAYTAWNPEVARLTSVLCGAVGFRGVCDLDWREDPRDGEYKLLDFNPRLGAQFRLFEREDHVDVLRAMHLDLTGRRIPSARQTNGRRSLVETLDPAAIIAYRDSRPFRLPADKRELELSWWASDDPWPAVAAAIATLRKAVGKLVERATVSS